VVDGLQEVVELAADAAAAGIYCLASASSLGSSVASRCGSGLVEGEDGMSVVQYQAGVHQSLGWPNSLKDNEDSAQGSTVTTGTTSGQPPEVAMVNDTTMLQLTVIW
jgi:hypothetical protein